MEHVETEIVSIALIDRYGDTVLEFARLLTIDIKLGVGALASKGS